ncbi:MAG TPA: hypothetical protein DER09_00200 [Prolixibacteraceae bacterium]|nr:hypothetical protein [Prolixibacteraceae bacterium]
MNDFFYWLSKLSAITNLAAFIVGIFLFRNFKYEIKIVFYFVAFGIFTETFSRLFLHFVMKNAMPIGHFYFPVAFLLAGWFYFQILKDFIKPVFLIVTIALFEVYAIINSVFIQSLFEYASLEFSIGSILLFMFSVAFFIKVMVDAKITNLAREPLIWINTAFLVYYTVNFFYHSLYNLRVDASKEVTKIAVQFFFIMNLLFYFLITIAFLKCRKSSVKKRIKNRV